jgi:hypothetical protein
MKPAPKNLKIILCSMFVEYAPLKKLPNPSSSQKNLQRVKARRGFPERFIGNTERYFCTRTCCAQSGKSLV